MFDKVITVFNYHAKTGYWYPSVIRGADVETVDAAHATTSAGTVNSGGVEIIVTCSSEKIVRTDAGNKSYVGAKAFSKNDAPAGLITFAPECDFIYVGAWTSAAPLSDEDYDEGLYHHLNNEYDGVYMIHTVAFYDLLPHFEIGGD